MEITITRELTQRHFENLIVTAFEGGCSYWIDSVTPDESHYGNCGDNEVVAKSLFMDPNYVVKILIDGEVYELTQFSLISGYRQASKEYPDAFNAEMDLDGGNQDAETTDIIMQLALFGEIVYG